MASEDEIQNIIDYYCNLLIIQYHNKTKARAQIELFIRELLANGIIFDVRDGYDVDTAVGAQLDIIGLYVGVDRFYQGQVLEDFFSFIDYEEEPAPPSDRIGFADYTDFETKLGRFLTYPFVISSDLVLPDEDYRVLIKLKILQNNINHSHKSIDDAIFKTFGDEVRPDSDGNMTMYYFVPYNMSEIIRVAIQKDLLPRPAAVRLNYVIEETSVFYGFATYSGEPVFTEGFTDYTDYDTKEGETLKYSKLIS